MEAKDYVTTIGISLTFIISLINFFQNREVQKKSLFVNAITSERVNWMSKLRELISEYITMVSFYESKPILEGEDKFKFLDRLNYLQASVRLHLNINDNLDNEINNLIERINHKYFLIFEVKEILKSVEEDGLNADILNTVEFRKLDPKIYKEMLKLHTKDEIESIVKKQMINGFEANVDIEQYLQNYITAINKVIKNEVGYKGRDEIINSIEELTKKTTLYLKIEWEKVKEEAEKGNLKYANKEKMIPTYSKEHPDYIYLPWN